MAVFDDLFNRLGKLFGEIEDAWDFLNSIETSLHAAGGINAQYSEADRFQIDVLNGGFATFVDELGPYLTALQTAARQTLIEEVDAVESLPNRTLAAALIGLVKRMIDDGLSVETSVVTIGTPSYGGAAGNGKLIMTKNRAESRTGWPVELQNLRQETVVLTCTADAQDATVVSGEERFLVEGETAVDDLDRNFPRGGGSRFEVSCVHGGIDETVGPGGNYLKNSDFNTFSVANTPDNWSIVAGTPGTDILENAAGMRGGLKCLELKGTGTPAIRQRFTADDQATPDLTTRLKPGTLYCTSVWLMDGAVAPSAGTLEIKVWNGSSSDITASILTVTLTSLTAAWQHFFVVWQTPKGILATPQIRVAVTVAMGGATESFLMDELVLTELYTDAAHLGAPRLALVAGAVDWEISDRITVANTRTGGKLLKFMDAAFGLHESGILIPAEIAATSEYDDALVT